MGGLALALFLADVAVGTSDLSILQALVALFAPETDPTAFIVREIRLPAALTAVTVGASLSLAGLLIQTITANPLASPTTLGIRCRARHHGRLFHRRRTLARHRLRGLRGGTSDFRSDSQNRSP